MKEYDLDRSMFISASVFFSMIFLPMLAMCVVCLCIEFVRGILVSALGLFALYAALMIYLWLSSHKHKRCVTEMDSFIHSTNIC